jgi:putative chitinase
MIDRKIFFDRVRKDPFGGELEQSQVDGLNAILDVWEEHYGGRDQRFLAYSLATTYHETAATMEPIEEYGKGEGQPYGEPDPGTGECYYGRGYVQLTWAENYRIADKELGLWDDRSCYGNPANALLPDIAAQVLFEGMMEGWFRADDLGPHTLGRYFGATANDPYGAREIINGDKNDRAIGRMGALDRRVGGRLPPCLPARPGDLIERPDPGLHLHAGDQEREPGHDRLPGRAPWLLRPACRSWRSTSTG